MAKNRDKIHLAMDDDLSNKDTNELAGGDASPDVYDLRDLEVDQNRSTAKKLKTGLREAGCDQCVLSTVGKIAFYLCYMCDIYLCDECLHKHAKDHEFVKLESEKSERELMAELFIGGMRNERKREEGLLKEDIKVYGRVNVKQDSDEKGCALHGLCRLENKMMVVLDSNNSRMKIYNTITNNLLRCIRFGAQPWEATEIPVKQQLNDTLSESKSKAAARSDSDKQSFLAVAFPWIKQIWILDVNKTPAVKTRTIHLEEKCWSTDFSDEKLFCLCVEYVGQAYSIHILSKKGKMLKVIQNNLLKGILPNFVCLKDKIYISDYPNNRVLCINASDGSLVSELTIDGSGPAGITIDNRENVYVCAKEHDKVYKLSQNLLEFKSLSLDSEFTREPDRLCFVDDKLIIGHYWGSSLNNFVTVVQMT